MPATLERWHAPAALDVLKDTPFNCLVVSWAAGLPEDASQQKTAGPLVAAARQRNLMVIGWVEGSADPQAAIASAQAAGLSAVAIKGFQGKSNFTVIPWGDQRRRALRFDGGRAAGDGQSVAGSARGERGQCDRRSDGRALGRLQRLVHPARPGPRAVPRLGHVRPARQGRRRAGARSM